MLLFCLGCQKCIDHQDIAKVSLSRAVGYGNNFHIDSIFVKANDSITGCSDPYRTLIGSETHSVKFPINVSVQLFAQGNLLEELFLKMNKNTMLSVYNRVECSDTFATEAFFPYSMELAKKHNRFIESSLTDDYCWLLIRMDNSYDDNERCTEWPVSGEHDLCGD
jgi:hypothetical protein